MATYWHHHDRGFANLCDIVRATTPAEAEELAAAGYERLTVAQLRRHVRWVHGESDAINHGTRDRAEYILNPKHPNHEFYTFAYWKERRQEENLDDFEWEDQ